VEVLSSRVLLQPANLERSRAFYRDVLGLAIYREFGTGPDRGTVFFLGGGFLELSGHAVDETDLSRIGVRLWFQVRDATEAHRTFTQRGVRVLRDPKREPWGLIEMWIADPDGMRICVVEVPEDHPLRHRE
jgi:predicted enzyme related to lactoylglutathione lyase